MKMFNFFNKALVMAVVLSTAFMNASSGKDKLTGDDVLNSMIFTADCTVASFVATCGKRLCGQSVPNAAWVLKQASRAGKVPAASLLFGALGLQLANQCSSKDDSLSVAGVAILPLTYTVVKPARLIFGDKK